MSPTSKFPCVTTSAFPDCEPCSSPFDVSNLEKREHKNFLEK